MVSITHPNASDLLARDIHGLQQTFRMKMKFIPEDYIQDSSLLLSLDRLPPSCISLLGFPSTLTTSSTSTATAITTNTTTVRNKEDGDDDDDDDNNYEDYATYYHETVFDYQDIIEYHQLHDTQQLDGGLTRQIKEYRKQQKKQKKNNRMRIRLDEMLRTGEIDWNARVTSDNNVSGNANSHSNNNNQLRGKKSAEGGRRKREGDEEDWQDEDIFAIDLPLTTSHHLEDGEEEEDDDEEEEGEGEDVDEEAEEDPDEENEWFENHCEEEQEEEKGRKEEVGGDQENDVAVEDLEDEQEEDLNNIKKQKSKNIRQLPNQSKDKTSSLQLLAKVQLNIEDPALQERLLALAEARLRK
jgi:hypothetical protein